MVPVLFSEPDRMGGDQIFIDTIKNNGVIVAQVGTTQTNRERSTKRRGEDRRPYTLSI
jgi:hypothetical protein